MENLAMLLPFTPRRAFTAGTLVLLLGLALGAAGIDPRRSPREGEIDRREARGQGKPAPAANPVWSVAWSPDGKRFASGGYDGLVRLWGPDGSEGPVLAGHLRAVTCVAWRPDAKQIASAGQDGTVRLWDASGKPGPALEGHSGLVACVAWSPDGKQLASGGFVDKTVRLWAADGMPGSVLSGHKASVHAVAWSPD